MGILIYMPYIYPSENGRMLGVHSMERTIIRVAPE